MRKRLEIQATYDSLTGCHNRASAMRAVDSSVGALSRDHDTGLAVIYIDIDQFKAINDAYGHPAGDLLLKVVAERLRQAVRNDDVVGRIGGDEFVVICARVGSPSVALRVAEVIAAKLCTETELGENEVQVRASIGVAWTDEPDLDGELLVASADAAMYASKHGGQCQAILADAVSTTVRRAPIH
jgi:diguanylate cyclase (GGDEF)-like protein